MLRRLALIIVIVSTLVAVAVGGFWLRSRATWESAYIRTGGWFWQVSSGVGSITAYWYGGWPSPPAYRHIVYNHDPVKNVGPVFAFQYAGASRSKWQLSPAVYGEYGPTRVVVGPSGVVQWNALAVPLLQSFTSTDRFSPLFRFWSVTVPYWAVLVCLLLPVVGLGARRLTVWIVRRSRRSRGLCPECAYDIRYSSSRCPECGRDLAGARGKPIEE